MAIISDGPVTEADLHAIATHLVNSSSYAALNAISNYFSPREEETFRHDERGLVIRAFDNGQLMMASHHKSWHEPVIITHDSRDLRANRFQAFSGGGAYGSDLERECRGWMGQTHFEKALEIVKEAGVLKEGSRSTIAGFPELIDVVGNQRDAFLTVVDRPLEEHEIPSRLSYLKSPRDTWRKRRDKTTPQDMYSLSHGEEVYGVLCDQLTLEEAQATNDLVIVISAENNEAYTLKSQVFRPASLLADKSQGREAHDYGFQANVDNSMLEFWMSATGYDSDGKTRTTNNFTFYPIGQQLFSRSKNPFAQPDGKLFYRASDEVVASINGIKTFELDAMVRYVLHRS